MIKTVCLHFLFHLGFLFRNLITKKKSGRELLEGKKLLKRNLTFVLLLFIFTSFFIFILGGQQNKTSSTSATNEPLNDIEKYLSIRKQVEQRRKNLFPVFLSKPPQGFKDYLMNRKTYLLQGNERCR